MHKVYISTDTHRNNTNILDQNGNTILLIIEFFSLKYLLPYVRLQDVMLTNNIWKRFTTKSCFISYIQVFIEWGMGLEGRYSLNMV